MSDSIIHSHNEITGPVPVNHHQHDDSRKYQKRRKREKDSHPEFSEEAVEDLLHHPEDEDTEEEPDAPLPAKDENDGQDHLNILL